MKAKFPAASDTVWPEQPVSVPSPSLPRSVMVTPARDVCNASSTTVRPKNEVVTPWTLRVRPRVSLRSTPSTCASAVTVKLVGPVAWPAGVLTVRRAVWPPPISCGLMEAVTSTGSPETLSDASWEKPSLLFKLTV